MCILYCIIYTRRIDISVLSFNVCYPFSPKLISLNIISPDMVLRAVTCIFPICHEWLFGSLSRNVNVAIYVFWCISIIIRRMKYELLIKIALKQSYSKQSCWKTFWEIYNKMMIYFRGCRWHYFVEPVERESFVEQLHDA